MNELELKKRSKELEQTLQLQLTQLKKDSKTWLAVGGAVVAVVLVTSALAKSRKAKKHRASQNFKDAIQEPLPRIRKKSQTSSFFPPLKKRLFMALLSLGQTKLMEELKKRQGKWNEG